MIRTETRASERDATNFFKAISDPNRVRIMELLRGKELNVSEICQHFNMQQPSISHHLNILKNAHILGSNKRGKEVYYYLNPIRIMDCCNDFSDKFSESNDES